MAKFKINENLLSIINTISDIFLWDIEIGGWENEEDDEMDVKFITVLGLDPGYSKDLMFNFLEMSSNNGSGTFELWVRDFDGEEVMVNEAIEFSDTDNFRDKVKHIHDQGPKYLDYYEDKFGYNDTNNWTDAIFNCDSISKKDDEEDDSE